MSARQQALATLRTRVQGILVAEGFQTNAGGLVFLAEKPHLGPDDPGEAIAIEVLPDEPGHQGEKVALTLPIAVQAIVKADLDDPGMTVEAVIADIKNAVETDHDLGGTLLPRGLERGVTAQLDREDGSTFVGAAVGYRLRFTEDWGAP